MNRKRKIVIVILITLLLFFLGLVLLFNYGVGTKQFYSNNTQLKINIPKYSLFIKEYADGETYSIEFIMFGSEEHVRSELENIYESKNNNYKLIEWACINKGFYKQGLLVYEKR